MKTLQTLTILLTTSLFFICCEQNNSKKNVSQTDKSALDSVPTLNELIEAIAKGNTVDGPHIGMGSWKSEQYINYQKLRSKASIEELIELTDNNNSAVRCYAFQALASRKYDKVFSILLKHLKDTLQVETRGGCTNWYYLVGDYFINVVRPDYFIDSSTYKLNNAEKLELDSILLNDKTINLWAKYSVLEELAPTAKNYKRINELVQVEKNGAALKTLAKYRKQEDKKLISSFFSRDGSETSALRAVTEFPDNYFYPFVLKFFDKEWKRDRYNLSQLQICYQALAKYPRPETLERFDRTIKSKDEFRYRTLCKYLLVAIKKYPNKLYEPYEQIIKLDEQGMNGVKWELERNY